MHLFYTGSFIWGISFHNLKYLDKPIKCLEMRAKIKSVRKTNEIFLCIFTYNWKSDIFSKYLNLTKNIFKLGFGYQILILGTLTQRKYCKKKTVSLKLLDLTKYWVREAVHGGSVLRCILCKKSKNMEAYKIMKLRCFYQPGGLKKRGEI